MYFPLFLIIYDIFVVFTLTTLPFFPAYRQFFFRFCTLFLLDVEYLLVINSSTKEEIMNYMRLVPPQEETKKLKLYFSFFNDLLDDLETRDIPEQTIQWINEQIILLNSFDGSSRGYIKRINKTKMALVEKLKKEHNLVPRNYYRAVWTAIGIAVFGVPLGALYSQIIGNNGMIGIGLPIGLIAGMAVGSSMDKKAANEGRQLNVDHL